MCVQHSGQHKTGWQQGFGSFFLLWLLFDLCVVHLLCPQYAAGELFGCAVPAVVAVPTSGDLAPEDGGVPQLTAVALGGSVTEKGAVAHSCLWNTQSVVESPPSSSRRCTVSRWRQAPMATTSRCSTPACFPARFSTHHDIPDPMPV
ncbi:hypothetical protein [Chloracidobacterium thermophilum]|uniref:hypothetical protein n=1 Tax=Chloracidobacterium thermophilum TaxID=458033 RepID=UPI001BB2D3B4|nr:hypothetical protein [Chloracidobacterium thermophilum]QUV78919.1 hypothetical protein J8C08_01145 [Chloracidobacterium thermophilum]